MGNLEKISWGFGVDLQQPHKGVNLEPITNSLPHYGTGGATQVITTKPIESFTLNPLSGVKK